MAEEEAQLVSSYRVKPYRRLFIIAEREMAEQIRRVLQPLEHFVPAPLEEYHKHAHAKHIVIAACDFTKSQQLQRVAKAFESLSPLSYRVIYATHPQILQEQHLLFAIEIGARFTVFGPNTAEKLREHLRNNVVNHPEQENLIRYEEDIDKFSRVRDKAQLEKIAAKLSAIPMESEDVIRLQVAVNQALAKPKKVEFFLKKALQLNQQALWAASALGKFYIRNKQVAKGIEVLEKMSQFQELNGQRCLMLGNAYLNCGEAVKAERFFSKGDDLNEGTDPEFKEGQGKAKLLQGDSAGAFALLGPKGMSMETIAFLNMRGIMAVKIGLVDEGIRLYQTAMDGAKGKALCLAKLAFNCGLAFARSNNLEAAKRCFAESVQLGGAEFSKGKKPLQIVEKLIDKKSAKTGRETMALLDVVELESVEN